MRFILPDNLKFVKRFIEKTFFGALKVQDAENQMSVLVETVMVDANQYVWCCCNDELPAAVDKFPVQIKYVDKEKGIYMKVNGVAQRIANELDPASEVALDHAVDELTHGGKITLLKVKMNETVYYKKQQNGQINFYALAC
ncbi:hypothetical protein [Paraflavitalea pollutisoli]|uniref:hypothetical protein n=1 Tax=Paraflavitalea pollutisoli TaxID=3034143 RepID=UPI0023ED2A09|nr:hypothetical protein [Paraflavitalea sp. H1-2-19X]